MSGILASPATAPSNLRASERHTCEVPTTCQPASAWCKDPWPITIRDISAGGISLTLKRRFERGTCLSIELPTRYSSLATVLARVVHVQTYRDGGWLLGCAFVSDLADEEVNYIQEFDPRRRVASAQSSAEGHEMPTISGVLFQARIQAGEYLRWYVKRLDLDPTASWPLAVNKYVLLSVGGLAGAPPVQLKVKECRLFGSYWIVECKLRAVPSHEVLRTLACPSNDVALPPA